MRGGNMRRPLAYFGNLTTDRLGDLWVARSKRGLVAVDFGISRRRFEAAVRHQTGMELTYAPHLVAGQLTQLRQYLDGRRRRFSGKIDWSVVPAPFQRAALEAVLAIPYGQTRTYAQIARSIGHPGAARAVGCANAANPMPLVIPCHRVIGADGSLRGYGGAGGLKTKGWLLKMESSHAHRT